MSKIEKRHIGFDDRPERFDDLSNDEKGIVLCWIREKVQHQSTILPEWTSYALKHFMERDTGLYITNGAFKGAMQRCGFVPEDAEAINWEFYVVKKG